MTRAQGWLIAGSIAFAWIAAGVLALLLWPFAARVNRASVPVLDCRYYDSATKVWRGNPNCLPSAIQAITGSIRSGAGSIAKAMPEIAESAKAASKQSVEVSKKSAAVLDNANGLISDGREAARQLQSAIAELHGLIADMRADIGKLLESSDESVKQAGRALAQLTALEKELQKAVAEDNPKALEIMQAMLDVMRDPHITSTLGNIDQATAHGASIVETVDIATLPLRRKANLFVAVLKKAIGLFKLTISVF